VSATVVAAAAAAATAAARLKLSVMQQACVDWQASVERCRSVRTDMH